MLIGRVIILSKLLYFIQLFFIEYDHKGLLFL